MDRAEAFRNRTAVVASEGEFTYADLLDASARVAAALLGGRQDLQEARVAFLAPPGFQYTAVLWGAWRAGGVAMPLSLRDTRPELEYTIDDAGATLLIAHPSTEAALRPIAEERGIRFESTTELMDGPHGTLPRVDMSRRATVLYTSGTTSKSKGVVVTHANIEAQVTSLVEAWEWTRDDHILNALPLHHVHGIVNALACALWVGAACEILPRFDADRVWARLAEGDLTLYMAVPTSYRALIKTWNGSTEPQRRAMSEGSSKLRLMVSGSDKLDIATLNEWRTITGHVLLERYGMTEIGMALSNPLHGDRVAGSVGTPLPGVEVRVVELDTDAVSGEGEHDHGALVSDDGAPGELQVRGPGVFQQYWGRPEATGAAFSEDGWFCTGDVVAVKDGRYRILGRASQDFMISGGENVSLREVEEVISAHPDIEACAVVAAPDEYWGKAVAAAVTLRGGAQMTRDDLREWARNRLADHKLPRKLLVRGDLPRTSMGKVMKPEVVRLFLDKDEPVQ